MIKRKLSFTLGLVLCVILSSLVFPNMVAAAGGTTSVTITKYAADRTTVIKKVTIDYRTMESTLPVQGDGTTHYYLQGPVFKDDADPATQEMLRWNPEEDANVQEKDYGALRGTNIKDLCNLVGGMAPGDELKVKAMDGWNKTFAYKNVYQYSPREGPMVLTWKKNGMYPNNGYTEGMRVVWFADDSTNPWGIHAFGNWDWHEAAGSEYWYYYVNGAEKYPTTTGLSGQTVAELIIYSTLNTFTLTTAVSGQGTVTPGAGEHAYAQGSLVNLKAVPASGWKFSEWDGDVANPVSASTTTVMNEDKSVTAVFIKKPPSSGGGGGGGGGTIQYTLNLSVNGQGTITPAAGPHSYAANTVVTLTAVPDDGWLFASWTGGVTDPEAATTTVTLNGNKSVTANFSEVGKTQFSLTVTTSGEGIVTRSPANQNYTSGSEVTLTALPALGWQFSGWSGEVSDPGSATTKVLMTGDESIQASFTRLEFILNLNVTGQGTIKPFPVNQPYAYGTEVTITAVPSAGWQFSGWSGDVTDTSSTTTTLVINNIKFVRANFAQLEYKLAIEIEGDGKVRANPEATKYISRTEVDLSAIPGEGWKFLNWEGHVGNKLSEKTTLIMDADQSIKALFVKSAGGGTVTVLQATAESKNSSGISPVYIGLAALGAAILVFILAITLSRRRR